MWDKLSLSDKSKVIAEFVKNGITDLNVIKKTHNSYDGESEESQQMEIDGGELEAAAVYADKRPGRISLNKILKNLEKGLYSDAERKRIVEFIMRVSGGDPLAAYKERRSINKALRYKFDDENHNLYEKILNPKTLISSVISNYNDIKNQEYRKFYEDDGYIVDSPSPNSLHYYKGQDLESVSDRYVYDSDDFVDAFINGTTPEGTIDNNDDYGIYKTYLENLYNDNINNIKYKSILLNPETLPLDLVSELNTAAQNRSDNHIVLGANADNNDRMVNSNGNVYDAEGNIISFVQGQDGKLYARHNDVMNYSSATRNWDEYSKLSRWMTQLNNTGNPVIVTTPWEEVDDAFLYRNNLTDKIKGLSLEDIEEYKQSDDYKNSQKVKNTLNELMFFTTADRINKSRPHAYGGNLFEEGGPEELFNEVASINKPVNTENIAAFGGNLYGIGGTVVDFFKNAVNGVKNWLTTPIIETEESPTIQQPQYVPSELHTKAQQIINDKVLNARNYDYTLQWFDKHYPEALTQIIDNNKITLSDDILNRLTDEGKSNIEQSINYLNSYLSPKKHNNNSPTAQNSDKLERCVHVNMMPYITDFSNYLVSYDDNNEIKTERYGKVSANIFNAIADAAVKAGVDVWDALGLSAHETKFGKVPYCYDDEYELYKQNKIKIRDYFNMNYVKNYGEIPNAMLVNGYTGFRQNKGSTIYNVNGRYSNEKDPLVYALKAYDDGLFNTNEEDHTEKVQYRGVELSEDPAMQAWYKEWLKSKQSNK